VIKEGAATAGYRKTSSCNGSRGVGVWEKAKKRKSAFKKGAALAHLTL